MNPLTIPAEPGIVLTPGQLVGIILDQRFDTFAQAEAAQILAGRLLPAETFTFGRDYSDPNGRYGVIHR